MGAVAAEILRTIDHFADNNQMDKRDWDYDYIYRRFKRVSDEAKQADFAGLHDYLTERRDQKGLAYEIHVNNENNTEALYFDIDGAHEEWAHGGIQSDGSSNNIVLFDPTAATNVYRFKLCCFVTVGITGKTMMLVVSLIKNETRALFEWCFRCFHKSFKCAPGVFVSDGDGEIARAVVSMQDVWKSTFHHLCVFHISKNLHKHLKNLFGSNIDGWKTVHGYFWNLAKDSDILALHTFVERFSKMVEMVKTEAKGHCPVDRLDAQVLWLTEDLFATKHQWAACFIWQRPCYGIHASQRAESNQSSVKRNLSANSLGRGLVDHIEAENTTLRDRGAIAAEVLRLRQEANLMSMSALLQFLQAKLTPYAFKIVLDQYKQASCYESEQVNIDDDEVDYGQNPEQPQPQNIDFRDANGCDVNILMHTIAAHGIAGPINLDSDPLWVVKRSTEVSASLTYDDEGNVKSYECDADTGLGDTCAARLTNSSWCSCLFPVCFGNLPCRHILHRLSMQQAKTYPIHLVHSRWLATSEEQSRRLVLRLRTTSVQARPVCLGAASTSTVSRNDKYAYLMGQFQPLVDMACNQNAKFDKLVAALAEVHSQFSEGRDQAASCSSASSAATKASQSTPLPAANSAARPVSVPMTSDALSLQAALGIGWRLDDNFSFDTVAELLR